MNILSPGQVTSLHRRAGVVQCTTTETLGLSVAALGRPAKAASRLVLPALLSTADSHMQAERWSLACSYISSYMSPASLEIMSQNSSRNQSHGPTDAAQTPSRAAWPQFYMHRSHGACHNKPSQSQLCFLAVCVCFLLAPSGCLPYDAPHLVRRLRCTLDWAPVNASQRL